jgi:hypothetical protein
MARAIFLPKKHLTGATATRKDFLALLEYSSGQVSKINE